MASQASSPNPSALGGFLASPPLAGAGHGSAVRELLGIFLGAAERVVDALAIVTGVYCGYALYRLLGWGSQVRYPASTVLLAGAGFALLFILLLERHGGYGPYVGLLAVRDTERILRVTIESFLLVLLAVYFTTESLSRLIVLLALVTVPIFIIFAKWNLRRALCFLRARGYGARKAVIVGAGTLGRRIYSALLRSPKFGLEPVAFVDDDPQKQGLEIYESAYQRRRAAKVFAGPVCPALLGELDASVLVIATPDRDRKGMARMAAAAGIDTYCVREDFSEPGFWIDHAEFDGITLAHFSRGQTRLAGDLAKRAMDVTVAAMFLLLLMPLFALVAVLVKKTSPGPALFRQERVGKDGRRFSICKFRTMYCDAEQYSYSPGAGDDARITRVGRWLRRTSLDQLPQPAQRTRMEDRQACSIHIP